VPQPSVLRPRNLTLLTARTLSLRGCNAGTGRRLVALRFSVSSPVCHVSCEFSNWDDLLFKDAEEFATAGLLAHRIFLACGFYTRQNPNPQKYDRAHNNPVCRNMQKVRAINQSGDQYSKANRIDPKRHSVSCCGTRRQQFRWSMATRAASKRSNCKGPLGLPCAVTPQGTWPPRVPFNPNVIMTLRHKSVCLIVYSAVEYDCGLSQKAVFNIDYLDATSFDSFRDAFVCSTRTNWRPDAGIATLLPSKMARAEILRP